MASPILLQAVLRNYYPDLEMDGVYGPQCKCGFIGLPQDLQALIVLCNDDQSIWDRACNRVQLETSSMDKRQNLSIVSRAIMSAAFKVGVPVKWLVAFAYIESRFNPLATNGQSKGLFQMQQQAWTDAAKLVQLPSFNGNWRSPYWNALAAAAFLKMHIDQLKQLGYDVVKEPRWLYIAHQQGAAGLIYLVKCSRGDCSGNVISSEHMIRNPAPGYGVTDNPVQFYKNWMGYLAQYF